MPSHFEGINLRFGLRRVALCNGVCSMTEDRYVSGYISVSGFAKAPFFSLRICSNSRRYPAFRPFSLS